MQSDHYQTTQEKYPNYITIRRTPELQQKTYSFKDSLFESFGNGYLNQKNNHKQKLENKILANLSNQTSVQAQTQSSVQTQAFQDVLEIAERLALIKSMFKMSKPILSCSTLLVNSQNKTKTEIIIHSRCKNTDPESKIICQNANKFLSFLDGLKNEQQKYLWTSMRNQVSQYDLKINLESRIQNKNQTFTYQSKVQTNTNFASKDFSSKAKYSQKPLINQENDINQSFSNQSFPYQKQSQFISHQNGSFLYRNDSFSNQDHSNYINSYQKTTQITHNSENTDRMFQKIQTPKMYQDHQHQKNFFIPNQESNPSKTRSKDQKLDAKKFRKFEKEPPSSAILNSKNKKTYHILTDPQNTHNQKMHKQFRIEQYEQSKKSNQTTKEMNKSPSQRSQKIVQKYKEKQTQKVVKGKQRIKITKDKKYEQSSQNLAFKVLDKTSQFQKMLKMTSSQINPT